VISGYVERRKEDRDNLLSLAWHVAALSRKKVLPSLGELLGKLPEPQTDEEIFANLEAWANAHNSKVKG